MIALKFSDSHIASLTALCSACRSETHLPFVGVRLFSGAMRLDDTTPSASIPSAVVCGASLPHDVGSQPVLEYPLVSSSGLALGVLAIPDVPLPLDFELVHRYVCRAADIADQLLLTSHESLNAGQVRQVAPSISAQIFAMSVEMFCIAGMDGRIKKVNPAFVNELGYSPEELIAGSYLAFLHPDDKAATLQAAQTLLQEGSLKRFRNRFRCRDNSYKWLEWSCVFEPTEGLVYSIARDVTEQVSSENAVRESNQLLRTVSQTLMNFISVKDSANPFDTVLAELLRITASEYGFIGEVLREEKGVPYLKTHSITNIAWNEATRSLFAAHATTGLEFRNLKTLFGHVMVTGEVVVSNSPATDTRSGGLPSGHPPMSAFLGMPIYSGSTLIGMIGLANRPGGYDDRMIAYLELFLSTCSTFILAFRAERARQGAATQLKAEELRRRSIVETALDGILTITDDGHIDSCNRAMSEILGYDSDALAGKPMSMLFELEAKDLLENFILRASTDTDQRFRGEMDGIHRNGKRVPLDIALSAANLNGQVVIVGVIRDVSLIQETKRELIEAKLAAEAANAAKSDFLAHMSHEIRTPITGVIGMTELALNTELSDVQRDYLSTALDSSESLLFLVNDILDFSKIEAGQLVLERTAFNLREILEKPLKEMAGRAARKQLGFSASIDETLPPLLIGDPLRIRQILMNLIGNAIKFTVQGEVSLYVRVLSSTAGEVLLRFEVIDSGIGISKANQNRIFSAFAQADPSISRNFGGTGLGLSISASLVESMGGRISVSSSLGEGSNFQFEVRFQISDSKRDSQKKLAAGSTKRIGTATAEGGKKSLKVLVVEDNVVNQRLISTLLAQEGHSVLLATNGLEAIEMAARNDFDIILMDIQMPVMDGLEASRIIRSAESLGTRRVPIIALTANAVNGVSQQCREAGMDGYLTKPLKTREIVDAVEKMAIAGWPQG